MQVGGGNDSLVSEINVTPFVDVMLVLLIIFMISAPMLVQGVDVNLPQTAAAALDTKNERLVVTITENENIFLDDVEVSRENLAAKIKAVLENKADQTVYLRADGGASYGFVVQVMAALKESGVAKLGMVTDPVEKGFGQSGDKDAKQSQ